MNCHCCNGKYNSIGNNSLQCVDCKHIYVDYKEDGLQYHKDEYRKKFGTRVENEIKDGKFTEVFHKVRKKICENRISKISDLINKDYTLLDVGAGGGTFINMAKDKFLNIDCQEISTVCIENLKDYGYKVYEGDFNSIEFDKKYDVVTCYHALEHIKDIKGFLLQVKKVTKKFLVIEVPKCKQEIPKDFKKRGWDGHYHYFSEESLKKLFENSFKVRKLEDGVQTPALFTIMEKLK